MEGLESVMCTVAVSGSDSGDFGGGIAFFLVKPAVHKGSGDERVVIGFGYDVELFGHVGFQIRDFKFQIGRGISDWRISNFRFY